MKPGNETKQIYAAVTTHATTMTVVGKTLDHTNLLLAGPPVVCSLSPAR